MTDPLDHAVAIVGVGAILPDAPDAAAFWRNVTTTAATRSARSIPQRWDPALYYDPDPQAPEKTYSKIGGWVRDWDWDPLAWKLPIPPKVGDAMDDAQKWAVACTRMALIDAGWPERPLDLDRTAVILGNAMAGEKHYLTALRITFPELARELEHAASFAALPADVRATIEGELHANLDAWLPVDHRGHDAGRAGQLHRRPGRQPLQPPRAELHRRRGLRLGDGGDGRGRRRAARPRVRRRDHRRRRPQHGRPHVRQVLRDRRAVAHRHAPVRGRRRRLRDGRGRGAVRAQAPRRRRARRRPHLRRGARRGRRERRQGQGHHRAQPGRPAPRGRARLAERGAVARGVHADRGPRHLDERRRRGRARAA